LTADNKSLSSDLSDTEEELETSQEEVADLEEIKETLVDETTTLTSNIADTESSITDLTDSIDALQLSYDDFSDFTYCAGSEFDDFSSTSSSYKSQDAALYTFLIWFIENFYEPVDGLWFTFYDDDMSPIYFELESSTDFDVFLIYLDDSSLGTTGGVYYVTEQCWVDLQ
jgi:hypothetical protein